VVNVVNVVGGVWKCAFCEYSLRPDIAGSLRNTEADGGEGPPDHPSAF